MFLVWGIFGAMTGSSLLWGFVGTCQRARLTRTRPCDGRRPGGRLQTWDTPPKSPRKPLARPWLELLWGGGAPGPRSVQAVHQLACKRRCGAVREGRAPGHLAWTRLRTTPLPTPTPLAPGGVVLSFLFAWPGRACGPAAGEWASVPAARRRGSRGHGITQPSSGGNAVTNAVSGVCGVGSDPTARWARPAAAPCGGRRPMHACTPCRPLPRSPRAHLEGLGEHAVARPAVAAAMHAR
jgi:hypothetical protein